MAADRDAIVKSAYAAWSRGDLDTALTNLHPDIVWQMAGVFPGIEPIYHGHEGVRRFSADFREPWASITVEVLHLEAIDGARVLATVRFDGQGRGSGVRTTADFPQIWTFNGDQVVHFQASRRWMMRSSLRGLRHVRRATLRTNAQPDRIGD